MPVTERPPALFTGCLRVLAVAVGADGTTRVDATATIDPDNPVFAGHFPHLPVFPGVGLIECAHRTVLAAVQPAEDVPELVAVERARFVKPVFPDRRIFVRVSIGREPGHWTVIASFEGSSGPVGEVRLRYRTTLGGSR